MCAGRFGDYQSMTSRPLVSVVIPTYCRATVREAVESALNQTYQPVEVIVVDDSGEGAARTWLSDDLDIELLCPDLNLGSNRARKYGFERSNGDYVHFLDDDDVLAPEKVAQCVDVFSDSPSLSVVYSGVEFRGECHYPKPDAEGDVLERALEFDMWPCMTSSMLIERDAIDYAELFEELPGGDDLQMMIELADKGDFGYVDEILVEKGDPEDSRGGSKGAVDGRFEILTDYGELYQRCPDSVYRSARGDAEFHQAKYYLNERLWSVRAILSMARHCYWKPDTTLDCGLKIAASLLGRPGWRAGNWLQDTVRGGG